MGMINKDTSRRKCLVLNDFSWFKTYLNSQKLRISLDFLVCNCYVAELFLYDLELHFWTFKFLLFWAFKNGKRTWAVKNFMELPEQIHRGELWKCID